MSNTSNKQNFISLLGIKLQAIGCIVIHAEEDADRLIVETAVESSLNHPTIVVADDTDALILLKHYAPTPSHGLFLQNCRRMISDKYERTSEKILQTQSLRPCSLRMCYNIRNLWAQQGALRREPEGNPLFIYKSGEPEVSNIFQSYYISDLAHYEDLFLRK